jgi:hypothetical protein
MISPLYKLGYLTEQGMVLVAIIAGIAFGYILVSVGMGNARKISAVFYGEDWSVMKIMFSAVVTTMLLTYSAHYIGILDIQLVQLANVNLSAVIIGGLLFGVGMAVGGYCPGTSIVAAVTQKKDAFVFIGGFFVGVWLYAVNYPMISKYLFSENLGKLTLSDIFGVPYGVMVLMVVFIALGTFYLLEKFEGKIYRKAALANNHAS